MSAWGTTGAWASQVDEEEQSGGQLGPTAPAPAVFGGGDESFPTLGASGKVSKRDKRQKGKPVSLAEFQGGQSAARGSAFVPSAARQQQPAEDPLRNLPTGPRERNDDEEPRRGGLGGAFTKGFGRERDDEEFSGPREDDGPSKADMSSDWGADRKFVASDRSGGFGSSSRSFEPSRADESRGWGRDRASSQDLDSAGSRPSSRGGGFEDRGDFGPSKADSEDRWGSKGFVPASRDAPSRSDSGTWGASRRSSSPPPPAGSRPRLALKPRTLPVPERAVPKSAASSESGNSAAEPEGLSVQMPAQAARKSNPFGTARPREDVLKEQGRDHQKEDAALARKGVDRPDTEEEETLKKSILELRARIEAGEGEQNAASSGAAAESADAAEAPLPNGTASADTAAAEPAEADSKADREPASSAPAEEPDSSKAPAADSTEEGETAAEGLERLEAELARIVTLNDDNYKYQRTTSGRW